MFFKTLRNKILRFLQATRYSLQGWYYLIKYKPNINYLLFLFTVTLIIGLFFDIDILKIGVLLSVLGVITVIEIVNTAIEEMLDILFPGYHYRVKIIKDIMSGAVFYMICLFIFLSILFYIYQ